MSSWWHAAAGSLLGTGAGSVVTMLVTERHAKKRERRAMAEALAAIQTELLVAAMVRVCGSRRRSAITPGR